MNMPANEEASDLNAEPDVKATRLQRLLIFAGVVELALGFLHFAMPNFYRKAPGLASLDANEDAFVVLVTYAVGILLIAFGAVTLSFARQPTQHLDILVPYLVIKCFLWTGRLVLEVLYPVQLKLFYIEPFTVVVLPGLVLELGVFVVATLLARQGLRQSRS